jgi:hypothetical protein
MRRLLTLTLVFSLFSAVCSCPAADKPAPTQSSGSATPTTPDIKPIAGDEYADAVLQLYDLARCGCVCCCPHPGTQQPVSSCVGSRLVCRLNAIDTIGGFVKSQTAVLCLSHLLKEQCCLCASSPSGGDIESVLVALHAINALKNIGANAKSALVAINCACCISPDLTSAISAARTTILAPPKQPTPSPSKTPAPASDAVKKALDAVNAALTAVAKALAPAQPNQDLAKAITDLTTAIQQLETAKAATQPAASN